MHKIKKLCVFAFSKNTNKKSIIEKRKDANSIKKTAIRRKDFICDKIEYCLFYVYCKKSLIFLRLKVNIFCTIAFLKEKIHILLTLKNKNSHLKAVFIIYQLKNTVIFQPEESQ